MSLEEIREKIAEVKRRISFEDLIARDSGHPGKQEGKWRRYPCPLHHGDAMNFKINTQTGAATCFSKGCCSGADIIAYTQLKYGIDSPGAAAEMLLSGSFPAAKDITFRRHARKQSRTVREQVEASFTEKVLSLQDNITRADEYFHSQGIRDTRGRYLASDDRYFHYRAKYQLLDGTILEFKVPRLIIPYNSFGRVTAVKVRRDDSEMKRIVGDYALLAIRIDLFERNPDKYGDDFTQVKDSDVLEALQTRFKWWTKSQGHLYNAHVLMRKNGHIERPRLTYAICVEAEKTALALEDIRPDEGYRAISFADYQWLEWAFEHVDILYFLMDRDPNGRGQEIAYNVLHAAKREQYGAKVISPPGTAPKYDFTDAIIKDPEEVISYLNGYGIPLIPRTELFPNRGLNV